MQPYSATLRLSLSRRTKIATSLVGGALGLVAVGVAAPASAYHGGCYVDNYGNCSYAPLSLATEEHSPADRAAWGTTPDQHFAYFVTHDDDAPGFVIMDFPSLKGQALWGCQEETNGMRSLDVVHALERAGGYTFDQANNIHAAAVTIYCPWNAHLPPPSMPTAPAPE
ncbi:hypothetical protein BST20_07700 [Mycobacterium branderi]|nr:hypothetical protein BST20_07700 [Mycobacterium branderi]